MKYDLASIASQFKLDGELVEAEPFGSGHINDTYSLSCRTGRGCQRYVLQRINTDVFRDPAAMMENIQRVTSHIRRKVEQEDPALASRQLRVIETRAGDAFFEDRQGNYWRVYNRVENAVTYETGESPEVAYEAARMFGWFQRMLTDLPGPMLRETICDFHTTPKRLRDFQEILARDPCNRAASSAVEIEFVLRHAEISSILAEQVERGSIPVRIAHNDTKINNVLLDAESGKGVCVIDLDTVMPGLSVYDFADLVRTAANPAAEDERDLSKVELDLSSFEMLAKGFVAETHVFLTAGEKEHLAEAAKVITFEQMIRFLGDYLAGDVYYKVQRPGQNLERARTQMKLVQSIMEQQERLNEIIKRVFEQAG